MIRCLLRRNTPLEHGRDRALGGGEAGHLGVGRVDQEQVDALLAEPGERPQVGDPAVQRQLVHLEVAGVQQHPGLGADGDGERVGDRVVDRDELAGRTDPNDCRSPSATSYFGARVCRCSRSFASSSARVSFEPISGMSGRSRSR